jgi:hypothetical protein
MMATVLSRIGRADVVAEPFPHVVARDVLDPGLCDRLVAEFPASEIVAEGQPPGSNRRFSYSAGRALADSRLSPAWRELIQAHVSQGFLDALLDVFGDHVTRLHPGWRAAGGRPRAGVRNADGFDRADVLLDAQVSINTPVTGRGTSVRTIHVDDPRKLFAGLFYLRQPGDDSRGGDLELYRLKGRGFAFHDGPYMDARYVERVATVPYGRNVLVLLVNSLHSLHGVSVRQPTAWTRCFLNLVAEVETPLFDLAVHQETVAGRLRRRIGRIARRPS